MAIVEHLQECAAGVDALDDVDAVAHRPGHPIPLGRHQRSPVPKRSIAFSSCGRSFVLLPDLLGEEPIDALRSQHPDLVVEALVLARHASS